jgi:hypothetical protein
MGFLKKFYFHILSLAIFSCSIPGDKPDAFRAFGEHIDTLNSKTVLELEPVFNENSSSEIWLKGKVAEVCQREGCWLKLENKQGSPVLVKMRNHSFSVPKDIEGSFIYIHGEAKRDTISVEKLREYAYDAGKSNAEIQSIRAPKIEIVVEANGVIIINSNAPQ